MGTSGSSGISAQYIGQSTTSITLTGLSGTVNLTTSTGLSYTIAQQVLVSYSGTQYFIGSVNSYNPSNGDLVLTVVSVTGTGGPFTSWTTNLAGASGGNGSSGSSGSSGSMGTSGTSGSSGSSGANGSSGSSGSSGATGSSGTSGATGASGSSGTSGANGTGSAVNVLSSGTSVTTGAIAVDFRTGLKASTSGTSGIAVIDTVYNTSLSASLAMGSAVGGFGAGTTAGALAGRSIVSIIDDLLFPTQNPTYTIPAISLSLAPTVSNNTYLEVGSTVNGTSGTIITITGTKNDAGAYNLLSISINGTSGTSTSSPTRTSATALSNQYGYTNQNNPNYFYSVSLTDNNRVIAAPSGSAVSTTLTYSGQGSYDAGNPNYNNKGVLDTRSSALRSTAAPQSAGSNFAASSINIYGIYPYYYGYTSTQPSYSDIQTIIGTATPSSGGTYNRVLIDASGPLTNMNFNSAGQWIWFATYEKYATKVSWRDTAPGSSNFGSIGINANGYPDLIGAPQIYPITTSLWSGVNFKIYIAQKSTTLATATIS